MARTLMMTGFNNPGKDVLEKAVGLEKINGDQVFLDKDDGQTFGMTESELSAVIVDGKGRLVKRYPFSKVVGFIVDEPDADGKV